MFVISENLPFDIVLGADFLRKQKAIIDLSKDRLYLGTDILPVDCRV